MATHGSSAASAIRARRLLSEQFLMAQLYHAARGKRKRVRWDNVRPALRMARCLFSPPNYRIL
jgi:hypothetical protein